MKKLIFMAIMILVSGCATIFQGSSQDFTPITVNDTSKSTLCSAKNEEGYWPNLFPMQAADIEKDGNTMTVICENDAQKGVATIQPKFQGAYLVLDLLLDFCIISCIVDGVNNSFYEYPASAVVNMTKK